MPAAARTAAAAAASTERRGNDMAFGSISWRGQRDRQLSILRTIRPAAKDRQRQEKRIFVLLAMRPCDAFSSWESLHSSGETRTFGRCSVAGKPLTVTTLRFCRDYDGR